MGLSMTGIILMGRSMEREFLNGLIMLLTEETSMIIIYMGMEHINGLMGENILGTGESIKCMGKESLNGQMEEGMKVAT